MLDMTLATRFEPGTNVRGEAAGAGWSFLLPRLERGRVLCLGTPGLPTLRTLARLGREATVLAPGERARTRLRRRIDEAGLELSVAALSESKLPIPPSSVDLAVVCGRVPDRDLERVRPLLAPDAWLYADDPRVRRRLGEMLPAARAFALQLTPRLGDAETAIPADDARTRDYFREHGLEAASWQRRALRPVSAVVDGLAPRILGDRRGWLLSFDGSNPTGPPDYLVRIARRAGVDIEGWRFGLSAPGRYNSRKVVFFLFEPEGSEPHTIVKLTRDPSLNYRLENEYRSLTWLSELVPEASLQAPRGLFIGHHGGLAVVGESALAGQPLAQRTRRTPDCVYGRGMVEALVDLAERSAESTPGPQVAQAMDRLFRSFRAVYDLPDSEQAFLVEQIDRIAAEPVVPLVFQHGDPGVWNAIVTRDDRVGLLDWEAGEPWGMPLWDLFYFLRSYGIPAGGSHGRRDWLRNSSRHFMGQTALSGFVAEAVSRYCERVKLSPGLVEPLFHTCWMHRALKEATRRTRATLGEARYLGLLRLGIEEGSVSSFRGLSC